MGSGGCGADNDDCPPGVEEKKMGAARLPMPAEQKPPKGAQPTKIRVASRKQESSVKVCLQT